MTDTDKAPEQDNEQNLSRRQFIKGAGAVGILAVVGGGLVEAFMLADEVVAIPAAGGYLLVDTKKCSGCSTCMMACSLVHTGGMNHSQARIQISQDPFAKFPDDTIPSQCRQCEDPACVNACETGAMHADPETGVRVVDATKCIGCMKCIAACPFEISRSQWNPDGLRAQKCDLCLDTPYWDEEGGPDGKRACESVCPLRAITFTTELPEQSDAGYAPNLRGEAWAGYGYTDV